jgi:hypothetical protein
MIVPSSAEAVTLKQEGKSSDKTANEWYRPTLIGEGSPLKIP